MRDVLRPQWGAHVYISSTFYLRTAKSYLRIENAQNCQYQFNYPSSHVSAIYPCFNPANGNMIIGLRFRRHNQVPQVVRTFTRLPGSQLSDRVSDLTEDIIDTAMPGQADLAHLRPLQNWPEGSVAFYVCNGAKLLVIDGPQGQHNRSLFQQGSLVVVEGPKTFTIELDLTRGVIDGLVINWNQAFNGQTGSFLARHNAAMDNQEIYWDNTTEHNRTVAQFGRKVIFLGATESQYNSVCYELFNYIDHRLQLKLPEGSILEDVAPWNTGFKLIRARHLFQRSYESCFGPTPPNANQLTARLLFEAPTNQYIFRRILGLENNRKLYVHSPGRLQIAGAYEDRRGLWHNHQTYGRDDNVRRQLDKCRVFNFESHTMQLMEQHHAAKHTLRMAPPPLYPPVWSLGENNTNVLKYSSKAIRLYIPSAQDQPMDGATCKYGQQKWYKIVKKDVLEYQWTKDDQNYNLKDQNSYENKRFGDDYCWYVKQLNQQDIGTIQMYCLEQCVAPHPDLL